MGAGGGRVGAFVLEGEVSQDVSDLNPNRYPVYGSPPSQVESLQ